MSRLWMPRQVLHQAQWDEHGFAILTGLLTSEDLAPGLSELGLVFPSAHDFHRGVDQARRRPVPR